MLIEISNLFEVCDRKIRKYSLKGMGEWYGTGIPHVKTFTKLLINIWHIEKSVRRLFVKINV